MTSRRIQRIHVVGHDWKYICHVPQPFDEKLFGNTARVYIEELGAGLISRSLRSATGNGKAFLLGRKHKSQTRRARQLRLRRVVHPHESRENDGPALENVNLLKFEDVRNLTGLKHVIRRRDQQQHFRVPQRNQPHDFNEPDASLILIDSTMFNKNPAPVPVTRKCAAAVVQLSSREYLNPDKRQVVADWLARLKKKARKRNQHCQLTVVTSVTALAQHGFSVQGHSSWGAMVDEIRGHLRRQARAAKTTSDPKSVEHLLKILFSFDHVIIRGDESAAVWISNSDCTDNPAASGDDTGRNMAAGGRGDGRAAGHQPVLHLYYLVAQDNLPPTGPGYLLGFTSLLAVGIARGLLNQDFPDSEPLSLVMKKAIDEGLTDGLMRCYLLNQHGVAHQRKGQTTEYDRAWLQHLLERDAGPQKKAQIWHQRIMTDSSRLVASNRWSVLAQVMDSQRVDAVENDDTRALRKRLGPFAVEATAIARDIVVRGLRSAQQEHKLTVASFGKLKVVDRREFEDYWEIQAAIRQYLESDEQPRPLSLAVFGAPGTGKSFGVNQIARNIGGKRLARRPLEANLSQFTSEKQLAEVFHAARDISLSGQIPLVFFDEFDSQYNGQPFGWLRSFLAPMQDAQFRDGNSIYNTGRAIFVFTGGVNHSFEMLNARMRDRTFVDAKGPDFVSRLRRHLNVLGLNSMHQDDATFIVRRGILLRAKIEQYHRSVIDSDDVARIEDRVLNAFLTVGEYRHGVRSLEAIVSTSRIRPPNQSFQFDSLPVFDQLDMHVSAREFTDLVRPAK